MVAVHPLYLEHAESLTVEFVGEPLATSLEQQMVFPLQTFLTILYTITSPYRLD